MSTISPRHSFTEYPGNARRLEAAMKHLMRMFEDAESEQIEGRRFWGRIILEIPFENGEAKDIKASKLAHDRLHGTG